MGKTHIITHNDVDGLKSASHLLRLDSYANIRYVDHNKLTSKELKLFSQYFKKEDIIFLIERDPTKETINAIIKLSKKVKALFFFGHYTSYLGKEEYNDLIKNVYCLFSGSFNRPTETVVRPFVKALLEEIAPTNKFLSQSIQEKNDSLDQLRARNNITLNGWKNPLIMVHIDE